MKGWASQVGARTLRRFVSVPQRNRHPVRSRSHESTNYFPPDRLERTQACRARRMQSPNAIRGARLAAPVARWGTSMRQSSAGDEAASQRQQQQQQQQQREQEEEELLQQRVSNACVRLEQELVMDGVLGEAEKEVTEEEEEQEKEEKEAEEVKSEAEDAQGQGLRASQGDRSTRRETNSAAGRREYQRATIAQESPTTAEAGPTDVRPVMSAGPRGSGPALPGPQGVIAVLEEYRAICARVQALCTGRPERRDRLLRMRQPREGSRGNDGATAGTAGGSGRRRRWRGRRHAWDALVVKYVLEGLWIMGGVLLVQPMQRLGAEAVEVVDAASAAGCRALAILLLATETDVSTVSAAVQDQVRRTVFSVAIGDEAAEDERCVFVVLRPLHVLADRASAELVQATTLLVCQLAVDERMMVAFHRRAVEVLVQHVLGARSRQDSQCAWYASIALGNLVSNQEAWEVLAECDGVASFVANVFLPHTGDMEVTVGTCFAVSALSRRPEGAQLLGALHVHDTVTSILRRALHTAAHTDVDNHRRSQRVVLWACWSIAVLCTTTPSLATRCATIGTCELIVRVLRTCGVSYHEVACGAARALSALAKGGGIPVQRRLAEAGALDVLVCVIAAHGANSSDSPLAGRHATEACDYIVSSRLRVAYFCARYSCGLRDCLHRHVWQPHVTDAARCNARISVLVGTLTYLAQNQQALKT